MNKLLLALLFATFAFAEGPSLPVPFPPETETQAEAVNVLDSTDQYKTAFFRTLFVIIGVAFLVLLTTWLLKRMATGRPMLSNHHKNIKILERRPLSPQTILYQVEIGGRQVIMAESKVEITVLTQFDTLEKGREF